MRTMAIDYGDQRIGLAVSDLLGMLAGEAWTMQEWDMERAAKRIAEEAKARDVGTLVLGLPKNMDGTEGASAQNARAVAQTLHALTGLPVEMQDERGTTITAHSFLNDTNTRGKKRKNVVDEVAATIILQNFLDKRKNTPAP